MNKRNKLPTINDVAELAGVSKRTVSRVINNSKRVSPDTRARVQQVVEELNFQPNRHARGLAGNRSFLLGLVFDAPTLFINDIQNGILSVCGSAGYELVVHCCHFESERLVNDIMQFVSRAKLDGVILVPPISELDELVDSLEELDCRFVRFRSDTVPYHPDAGTSFLATSSL